MIGQIVHLLRKDIQLDLRQRFGLGSIFLYVFAALFVVYLAFGEMEGRTWVTLFWIVVLFASVNAVLKSFAQGLNPESAILSIHLLYLLGRH